MKRTGIAVVVWFAVQAVLASASRAESESPAVGDLRTLVWFAARHDRLWESVESHIQEVRQQLGDSPEAGTVRDIQYDLYLLWGDTRAGRSTPGAVDRALDIYGHALTLGLPAARTVEVRDKIIDLRLREAERLLSGRGDLDVAKVHVDTVLGMVDVPDASRSRARDLRFEIASDRANQLLDRGDLTNGYDLLSRVLREYKGPPSSKVDDARRLLRSIEETTGLLVLERVDVSAALEGASPEVVGETIPLPGRVAIHRVRDFVAEGEPVAQLDLPPSGSLDVRLTVEDGTDYTLRVGFEGDARPDLLIPFSLADRRTTIAMPDRIPARMAYVPARSGRRAYFVGLYEVSSAEMNAWRRLAGRPQISAAPDLPARSIDPEELKLFLGRTGVDLPTAVEWRHAVLGIDGRTLPWGRGAGDVVRTRATIDDWEAEGPEPVEGRAGDIGPFGLHHGLGNVWELVQGWSVMGGSFETPYPLILKYLRKDGRTVDWQPDLLSDPRPLEPAKADLSDELKRKWKAVLYRNPEDARVQQPGIGFRVVVRIDG